MLRKLIIVTKKDVLTLKFSCSLSAEDASRLLSSVQTTVIRTEAKATGETHVEGAAVTLPATTTTETVKRTTETKSTAGAVN